MTVRLYDLTAAALYDARAPQRGVHVRRLDAWDRYALRRFVREHFGDTWASEADFAFTDGHPIKGFIAMKDGDIVGFSVYETSRRNFFGPTGVREDMRGSAIGAALLLRCLESMRDAGYPYASIGGAGPAAVREKGCRPTSIPG